MLAQIKYPTLPDLLLIVGSEWGNAWCWSTVADRGGILVVNESWSGTMTSENDILAKFGHLTSKKCVEACSTSKLHKLRSSLFMERYFELSGLTRLSIAVSTSFLSAVPPERTLASRFQYNYTGKDMTYIFFCYTKPHRVKCCIASLLLWRGWHSA
jgi:hypothetical protein